MKRNFFCFTVLLLLLISCEKSSSPELKVSQNSFDNVSYNETQLALNIEAEESWTATSNSSWCTLSTKSGTGNATLTVSVTGNINVERTATITITSASQKKQVVQVVQSALSNGTEYHYKLPIIFHVLYKDKTDGLQYVSQSRIAEILKGVNSLYQNASKSVDMNLEFTLATTDENGNTLTTPGVEYVQWTDIPMDCMTFMGTNNSKNAALLWDPNKYINVMLYNFTSDNSGSVTLGISHMPYSITGANFLDGLTPTTYTTITKENLAYPYCLSINSLYINEKTENNIYNSYDVTITLAHELGHYVGLHHAFSEDEEGNTNTCINSDYCDDTPTYNRDVYEMVLKALLNEAYQSGKQISMTTAATREDCKTGQQFIGHNIMDYEICYSDQFTSDQRKRIRNVLTYSPLIPGPKKTAATKTRTAEGPLDLPIVFKK